MKKPIRKFQCSPISASIWKDCREVKEEIIEMHTTKISKAYQREDQKGSNKWEYTSSFSPDDLPKVILVASEAYKFLRLQSFGNDKKTNRNAKARNE